MMTEQDFKNDLLDVLSEFHQFCKHHDLSYYLIGGGLIGAVRHKGFIPWDDDIDVAMPRADFERFLSLRECLKPGFRVAIPFRDIGYTNTKPRMYGERLKIQEQFIRKYTLGPWVDIFPLDYTFDNPRLRKLHFIFVYVFKVLNACKLGGVSAVKGRNKATSKLVFYYILKIVPQVLLSAPFEWMQKIKKKPGRYVGNLMGRWREKEIIEVGALDEKVILPFEYIELFAFNNYDAWLTRVYGDYMKLPSVERRVPDHFFDVVDE